MYIAAFQSYSATSKLCAYEDSYDTESSSLLTSQQDPVFHQDPIHVLFPTTNPVPSFISPRAAFLKSESVRDELSPRNFSKKKNGKLPNFFQNEKSVKLAQFSNSLQERDPFIKVSRFDQSESIRDELSPRNFSKKKKMANCQIFSKMKNRSNSPNFPIRLKREIHSSKSLVSISLIVKISLLLSLPRCFLEV